MGEDFISWSHHFESFTVATTTWLTVMEYMCHKWPRICSTCRKHFPVLSSWKSWLITGFVTRLNRRVPLVEQELLTLPEHLSSPPIFSGVCFTRSLVLCVCFVDRCLSFFFWPLCCLFFFDILIPPLLSSNSASGYPKYKNFVLWSFVLCLSKNVSCDCLSVTSYTLWFYSTGART